MSDFLELTTAIHSRSLTLFVGAGFSRYITDGNAPSWVELLAEATIKIDRKNILIQQLFEFDDEGEITKTVYDPTICAQIIETECRKRGFNLKEIITEIIKEKINESTINQEKLKEVKTFFENYSGINVITTNYDTIFSDYVFPENCRVIIEGNVIPRVFFGNNIYHIHGCITKPESIILTLKDYYNFQNSNNYFSRKFYTLLQETTVAILGYSLGDFNLNTIVNEVNGARKGAIRISNIYFIDRGGVSPMMKAFYKETYGIKVIERLTIDRFFEKIEENYDTASDILDAVENLEKVIKGEMHFEDTFIKISVSFSSILNKASIMGLDLNDERFLNAIISVLQQKWKFTENKSAWEQYSHFADWMVELGCIMKIKGSLIEDSYCKLAKMSFYKCSKDNYLGYSWKAWKIYHLRWHEMKIDNQDMLKELIEKNNWPRFLNIPDLYKF